MRKYAVKCSKASDKSLQITQVLQQSIFRLYQGDKIKSKISTKKIITVSGLNKDYCARIPIKQGGMFASSPD